MNKNEQFKAFLESMKTHNPTLIEAIQTGYTVCFENMYGGDDLGDDMVTEEDEMDEPDDSDIFINSNGMKNTVTCEGDTIYIGNDYAAMESAIKEYMEENQFWPGIWEISDHGNVSRYTLD